MFALRLAVLACGVVAVAKPSGKSKSKDVGGGWEEKRNEDGRVVQQMKIQAPSMSEEDQYGYVMPEKYRCDSCKAVMYHLDLALRAKQPKNRRMKEWEYTDVLDETCSTAAYDGYGVKVVNGENVLSGPGLKQAESLSPGEGAIQMGGEAWSKRLAEICRIIVFEKVGEDAVYDRFYSQFTQSEQEDMGLSEAFCASAEVDQCTLNAQPSAKASSKAKAAEGRAENKKAKAKKASKSAQRPTEVQSVTAKSSREKPAADALMDVQSFFQSLAQKHGVPTVDYTAQRSASDWEKLMVSLSAKIFNDHDDTVTV